jgi:uncharacterized protein HemX
VSADVAAIIVAALALIGAVGTAWIAHRSAQKTAKQAADIEAQKVDAEAYERAQKINADIVGSLEKELARLRTAVQRDRETFLRYRRWATKRIKQLETAIRNAGLSIPEDMGGET